MVRLALLLVLGSQAACGFFRELESLPEAQTSTGDMADDGGTGPCANEPDICLDQDRIELCDPSSAASNPVDCIHACGEYENVACTALSHLRRSCWCVEPGQQKVLACAELEACLLDCVDASGDCGLACFRRTTKETTRLFGALIHCAEQTCRETCHFAEDECGDCIAAAREGHYACGVARGLCDQDVNDETWPPWSHPAR
ncbi:MAG: hypothetical protein B7733_25290 [Myxococcales bacterium FL481]|nr:MAG: hypothetical protein B7733_25290 [Myxococcales bacterium FL481]